MKIVYVKWDDASQGEEVDEVTDNCIQETVGFLFKKDKYNVILARDYNHIDGRYQTWIRIPKKYIVIYQEIGASPS